jgi:hypothetical protein
MARMPLERSERMALARDEHRLKTLANHSRLRVVNGYSEPVENVYEKLKEHESASLLVHSHEGNAGRVLEPRVLFNDKECVSADLVVDNRFRWELNLLSSAISPHLIGSWFLP